MVTGVLPICVSIDPFHVPERSAAANVRVSSASKAAIGSSLIPFSYDLSIWGESGLGDPGALGYTFAGGKVVRKLSIVAACGALLLSSAFASGKPPKKQAPRQKVTICHVKKGQRITMHVNSSAVASHMAHGDTQGACLLGQ
jgi:hypothetical protein